METVNIICVICRRDTNPKTIKFTSKSLVKSHEILKIREFYKLKYTNDALPEDVNDKRGYHAQCYKNYVEVMKKYLEIPLQGKYILQLRELYNLGYVC